MVAQQDNFHQQSLVIHPTVAESVAIDPQSYH